MNKLKIYGGKPLCGEVQISGAKNAALPILAASLLAKDNVTIDNVPHLRDVTTMMELLGQLGVKLLVDENLKIQINGNNASVIVINR